MAEKKKTGRKKGKSTSGSRSVNVYSLDGKVKGKVELPVVFTTPFRPDLIRRSVVSAQANRRQIYGPSPEANMRHAVSTWGKGRGVARVQRLTQGRRAAESPNNVGGRRAHPPKLDHELGKKINRKEKRLARTSALAACANEEMVRKRGHRFKKGITLPVVVDDELENMNRSSHVLDFLGTIGLDDDIFRAKNGIHERAGRGKMRGRRLRRPRSLLVIASEGSPVLKGALNLPGINTTTPKNLNTENLAPGGDPGRLLLISKKALNELGGE